jgi:hypothetical protein
LFIDHVDDIIASVFQYLKMLREIGPKDWIFKEVQVSVASCLISDRFVKSAMQFVNLQLMVSFFSGVGCYAFPFQRQGKTSTACYTCF